MDLPKHMSHDVGAPLSLWLLMRCFYMGAELSRKGSLTLSLGPGCSHSSLTALRRQGRRNSMLACRVCPTSPHVQVSFLVFRPQFLHSSSWL